ncbi:helix-turn-helix domain-containing protein [Polaribacter sp.]|nr:helix-turn-helix domain-containing protein [Polaribacter sp.]
MTSQEKSLHKLKENLMVALGKRVQEIRESKGLSQVDLAGKMLGKFDTTNISRIESGRTNPTIFTLFRIAEALEVPLQQILVFEDLK